MLIEVLVSAVILITASLAIFSTLTQADTASGNQANRVEAANFAQSELERIRSLPVEDIMDFAKAGTHSITRGGTNFKETVVAKWISDGGDEPECTGQDGGLDYLRTTVTISWDGMGNARPVTLTSLYTPSPGAGGTNGSISVHIINRDGGPDQGITVSVAGKNAGASYSGTTNVNGCVVFGFIPQDDYALTFNRNGWVDQDSNNVVKDTVGVTAGETSKVEYDYDQGGVTKAAFQTTAATSLFFGLSIPGITTFTVPSYPLHAQLWNIGQTSPGGFDVDLPGNLTNPAAVSPSNPYVGTGPASAWDGTSPAVPLYPFSDPYSVYAGNCPANATQSIGQNDPTSVNIPRGGIQNAGTVNVPALAIKVYDGTNNLAAPIGNARVTVDFGCGKWTRNTATGTTLAPTLATLKAGLSPWGVGTLGDPGFPYVAAGSATTPIRYCAWDPTPKLPTYPFGRISVTTVTTSGNANTRSGTAAPIYLTAPGMTAAKNTTTACM